MPGAPASIDYRRIRKRLDNGNEFEEPQFEGKTEARIVCECQELARDTQNGELQDWNPKPPSRVTLINPAHWPRQTPKEQARMCLDLQSVRSTFRTRAEFNAWCYKLHADAVQIGGDHLAMIEIILKQVDDVV